MSFVFFHGDLRLVFYTLPFLFVSWLFDFLFYYLEIYIQNSFNYINKILIVTPKTPLLESEMASPYIIKNGNDFKFKLTEFGYAEGFYEGPNNSGLNSLANSWLQFQAALEGRLDQIKANFALKAIIGTYEAPLIKKIHEATKGALRYSHRYHKIKNSHYIKKPVITTSEIPNETNTVD